MGTCRHCGQKAGFLRKQHSQCRDLHITGVQEMTQLAAQAAGTAGLNETSLRSTLGIIAQRSHATGADIERALEEGWKRGVAHAMSDGIISRQEEERLRAFRDNLALEDSAADPKNQGTSTRLRTASSSQVTSARKSGMTPRILICRAETPRL